MIISIFNSHKKTRKTITSIIFSKLLSKNYKVILIDLDPFSPYNDLYNFDSLMNFSNEKILKKNIKNISSNFDLIRMDIFLNKSQEDLKRCFLSIINELINKGYQKIIFDCSSSFGLVSKQVLSISDLIIVPFMTNDDNFENVVNDIYSLKIVGDKNKLFFIPFSNTNDKEINSKHFINNQKKLGFISLNYVINFYENGKLKDLIKNDKLIDEYKYVLKKHI
ncbi:MAG: AAA family ATPase [Mycoplasma sp.]|nr:AAA family ATPase [Mycoplasma sp.]